MENNEMIYTAIFQGPQGQLSHSRYTGVIDRKDAWLSAAKMGGSNNMCLLALVPGDHPVYFYDNFVDDNAKSESTSATKNASVDVYDNVYEMT
tara:strand:- start:86 stop:364 length:279 start_codon:yes stop_codon:yes gene_type:complete